MPAIFDDYAVTGTILPIVSTRLRVQPSTYTTVLNTYPGNTPVEIDLVREFTSTDMTEYHMKGDKWARVIKVNGQPPKKSDGSAIAGECWMAIKYLGSPICSEDYDLVIDPNPEPEPEPEPAPEIVGATVVLKYKDGTESEPVNMVVDNG